MTRFLFILYFAAITVAPVSGQESVYPVSPLQIYPRAATGGNYMYNYYLPPAGTGTPWWPAWSPDGDSLTFSMQGTLWQIGIGDSVAREIVHSSSYLSSPAWSPDGRFLVFTSDDGVGIDLHILDRRSGEVDALTEGDHLNLDPAWSPDGRRLAFVSTRPNGYFNVYIMEIEDGRPGSTTPVTYDHLYGKPRLYFGDYDLYIQPTWSPDGRELLIVSNRGIPLGSGGVWRVPAVENGIDRAVLIHKEETLYRTRPDWSPDGTRFIYSAHLGGQFNNLFVLPAGGGEPYKLTFGEWDAFHPRWSPDGHWIAYASNEEGLPQLRLLQTFGGREESVSIQEKNWTIPVGYVRVVVIDEDTGETVGARIYNEASDGKAYAPEGAYHRLGRLNEHFFHTDGSFLLEAPAGELRLEAMRGFEYFPVARTLDVIAGDTVEVELSLRRIVDLQEEGWYSGSNHVHMNYGGNLHNTPENLVFMANAEHVHVIGELICNKDNRILDYQYFTGKPHPLTSSDHVLYFNEEYRPPFYGHMSLINLKEHLISPFTTGYEGTAIESLYPSNTDMLILAREQGALGAYVHPFWGDEDPLEGSLGNGKSFPVDVALNTVDYHELVSGAGWAAYGVWHHVLNNGFKVPAVGGEDAISGLHNTAIMGQMRAYAYMPDGLSWDGWITAIRQGALFVTNGPLVQLTANGRRLGETVELAEEGGTVQLEGIVHSITPLDRIELVVNGTIIPVEGLENTADRGGVRYAFSREIPISRSSWITLQAAHSEAIHPIDDIFPQATTNPIWISVGGEPVRSAASAEYFIRWIDKLMEMASGHPGWRSEAEKDHVLGQFRAAREVYEVMR